MNFLNFILAHLRLAYQIYVISTIKMRGIMKEIQAHSQELPRALSAGQLKRISFYIGIILYEMTLISQLRGRKLSKIEIQRACYLGTLTPLIDDLNDELQLNSQEIKTRFQLKEPDEDPKIQVAQFFYQKLSALLDDFPVFFETLDQTIFAQDESLKQMQKEALNERELKTLTRDKGGFAARLYASMLQEPMKSGEAEAYHEIGYSFQLLNDMFDVWKDRENGQQTLFTRSTDWHREAEEYENTLHSVYSGFLSLDYSESNKRRFLINISILYGRGSVCMNQLLRVQAQKGLPIHAQNFARKELICDMEKLGNIRDAFFYSMQHYKKFSKT